MEGSRDIVERVLLLLHQLLSRSGNYPSQTEVAGQLCMSTRTLKRRLRERGTSFRRITTQSRMSHAAGLLSQEEQRTGQVAEITGYSSAANFVRAFRRWSGVTPDAYRKRQFEQGINCL